MAFLERPPRSEAEKILKDKSVRKTKLAPDIQRKLQKLAIGPEGTLEELLQAANWIYDYRDQEENQEQERRLKKKSGAPGWLSWLSVRLQLRS